MSRPLESLRVLDFTRLLPGPFATLMLADMGATVLKIEDPDPGDYLRGMGPPLDAAGSALFHFLNRGKRGIVLDLKRPGGAELVLRLARDADVLLEGFRPGVMERLGLSPEALQTVNPRLVYASISGYGQDGPWSLRAGHDLNYVALAGLTGLTGDPPRVLPVQLADLVGGGHLAAIAVLAGVLEARATGRGRFVDVSMARGVQSLLAPLLAEKRYAEEGGALEVLDGRHPAYGVYRCAGGTHLTVAALEGKFWKKLTSQLGLEGLEGALRAPSSEWPGIRRRLEETFLTRPASAWIEELRPLDCCVEPIASFPGADLEMETVTVVTSSGRELDQPAPFFETRPPLDPPHRGAPGRGEHTFEILSAAGLEPDRILELSRQGVVGGPMPESCR